jgi:hypothetical protein
MAVEPLEKIADEDELYRRLAPQWVKPDGSVASVAFELRGAPDPAVSVDLARLTDAETCLVGYRDRGFGLCVLIARDPRAMGLDVVHSPVSGNRAHSEIRGNTSKELCSRLASVSTVRIVPKG